MSFRNGILSLQLHLADCTITSKIRKSVPDTVALLTAEQVHVLSVVAVVAPRTETAVQKVEVLIHTPHVIQHNVLRGIRKFPLLLVRETRLNKRFTSITLLYLPKLLPPDDTT